MTEAEAIDLAYDRYVQTQILIGVLRTFAEQMIPVMEERQRERIQRESLDPESRLGIAELSTRAISEVKRAVDSASLIFAHTILDDFVDSMLDVCALACPEDWDSRLSLKKVEFRTVKEKDLATLRLELLIPHLKQLKRETLVERIGVLFSLTPPQAAPELDYTFDKGRLIRLDSDRHKVVHNAGAEVSFDNVESDLKFMENTVWFLMRAVHSKYDLNTRFSSRYKKAESLAQE